MNFAKIKVLFQEGIVEASLAILFAKLNVCQKLPNLKMFVKCTGLVVYLDIL